jgi:hypothetical protein
MLPDGRESLRKFFIFLFRGGNAFCLSNLDTLLIMRFFAEKAIYAQIYFFEILTDFTIIKF